MNTEQMNSGESSDPGCGLDAGWMWSGCGLDVVWMRAGCGLDAKIN